jgi:hypothetical protein
MKRRYVVLGISSVLALALTVPALGGPSNPIASSAASAKKLANKALKKANQANSAAQQAQTTAHQALQSANQAQQTANAAQTDTDTVSAAEIGRVLGTSVTETSGDTAAHDFVTAISSCPSGKVLVGISATTGFTTDSALQGAWKLYESALATAAETDDTGNPVDATAQAICINN